MGNPVRRLPSGHMPGGLHAGRIAELADEVRAGLDASPADNLSSVWDRISETAAPPAPGSAVTDPVEKVPVTFREAVSRWYENTPEGFDGAVASSQEALKKYGIVYPHSNSPAYGSWPAENVDAPAQVRIDPKLGDFGPRGNYGAGGVRINPVMVPAVKGRNATLEHELTHHLTLHGSQPPNENSLLAVQRARNVRERFDGTPDGSVTLQQNPSLALAYESGATPDVRNDAERSLRILADNERYAMQRAELDPRIAEVRRRYAFHTGRDVTTPQQAADAWEWYKANRGRFEDLAASTERPSMVPSQFDIYDSLPPESKQIMFRRMTQVPALLAPIGIGAAGQQGSVLDGLNRN